VSQRSGCGGMSIRLLGCMMRLGLVIGLANLLVPSASAQITDRPPDTMDARMRACSACHGERLAGKPAGYLMHQLVAFRDARRRYVPMNYLLEYLPDSYLQQMADYLSALRPPPPPPANVDVSPGILARGQAIVTHGDPARGVPACSGCHGTALTGMEPAIPGLVGLHASYISAQLGAFRYGTRSAAAPDCMQLVAASLTESDVTAVAAWLASRPVPADPSSVPRGSLAMPMACGSEPN
jgi:cytochrome c553